MFLRLWSSTLSLAQAGRRGCWPAHGCVGRVGCRVAAVDGGRIYHCRVAPAALICGVAVFSVYAVLVLKVASTRGVLRGLGAPGVGRAPCSGASHGKKRPFVCPPNLLFFFDCSSSAVFGVG